MCTTRQKSYGGKRQVSGGWGLGQENELTTEGKKELFGVMEPFCILHVMVL